MTATYLDALDIMLERYGAAIAPFQMCPPALFAEIVRTNHLRSRAVKYGPSAAEILSEGASGILERVHGFSTEHWADSKPCSKADWVLIGNIYQAAVVLYCVSSLQSLSVLPMTPSLRSQCAARAKYLQKLLAAALASPKLKIFTLWPLVVLGVEAAHDGSAAIRSFIAEQLPVLSSHVGTYVPLTAKTVLETFWASGETRWDACFSRPYAFTMQIAVDTSQIYRSVSEASSSYSRR